MDQAEAEGRVRARTGLVAALALCCAGPAMAQPSFPPAPAPTITVEGAASEAFLPDKAILSFGVVTERPRAIEASAENGKAVQAVIEAVKAEGIEPRAIQSTSVSLEPVFKQTQDGGQTIAGFRASNQLEVEVSPPNRAGLLAGTLIDRGVNTIDGISFASNANEERADRLRGQAMRDARHKAEIYVAALGLRLGRVLGIVPSGGSAPRAMVMKMATPTRAAPVAVPMEAGQQSESSSVSVTWEIVER